MTKKIAYILLFTIGIGLIIYFIFFSKLSLTTTSNTSWKDAVPSNVSWVAIINNPNNLAPSLDSLKYGENLKIISFIDELISFKTTLDSFQIKEGIAKKHISKEIYASFHLAGVGKMEPIIYIPTELNYKKLVKNLEQLKASSTEIDEEWEYKGLKLFGYNNLLTNKKFYFTIAGGNLIVSRVAFLVEDAVSAISDGVSSPINNNFSAGTSKESANSDLTLMFNFANSNLYLSTILSPEFLEQSSPIKEWGKWAVLDLYFNEQGIFYTGKIYPLNDDVLSLFSGKFESPTTILPNNTSYYFTKNITSVLDSKSDLKSSFEPWIGDHVVHFSTEMYDENFDNYFHYLISIKDNPSFESLREFSDKGFKDSLVSTCNGKGKSMFSSLLSITNEPENLYFCKIKSWIVVSESQSAIALIKDKHARNEVLKKDISFNELNDQLKEENSSTLYFNIYKNKILLKNAASIYKRNKFDSLFNSMLSFNMGMMQFKKESSNISVVGYLLHSEMQSKAGQLVWKAALDSKSKRVQVVKTQNGGFIVLAQDSLNVLYALTTGGNVLWKKPLESAIVGNIYDADFQCNGNKHYIFNTKKNIYRINENGTDMNEFPIKLPDSTAQPLVIIKSFKGDFMMFVQAKNGNLHGYEVNGKPLPGWNPVATLKPLKNKIRYYVEGGKGYIAAFTEDNKMNVFGENGAKAFSAKTINDVFYSPFSVDISSAPLKLKNISESGKVYSITNTGVENSAQLSFSHPIHFYTLKDIIGDKDSEILTAGENCVSIYSKTGEKIQSFCFDIEGKDFTYLFVEKEQINENNYLIATSKSACVSYLIKLSSKMTNEDVKAFPICGEIVLSKLFDSQDNFLLSSGSGEVQVYRVK